MKTIVFGDIHGRMEWENVLQKETFDNVVFLGDYVDSHEKKTSSDFVCVLTKLIELKQKLGNSCVLLYGNHDASYLNHEHCSSWSSEIEDFCLPWLEKMYNEKLIQPLYIQDDIIFSHAGVTKTWLKDVVQKERVEDVSFATVPLSAFQFNDLSGFDPYGDTISQSPTWVRPYSLVTDKVNGFRQIVGHTQFESPFEYKGCFFIDNMPQFYAVVEDGKVKFVKIK